MDKWRITGADAQTGADRSIEVNARDEAGAREAARMLGMLVNRVEPLAPPQGPVLDYLTPGIRNLSASIPTADVVPPAPPPRSLPQYPAILAGVAAVSGAAKLLYTLGTLALTAAVLGVVAAVAVIAIPNNRPLLPWVLLTLILTGVGGAIMLAAATALQLLAATSLAIRDTARNSFAPADDAPQ